MADDLRINPSYFLPRSPRVEEDRETSVNRIIIGVLVSVRKGRKEEAQFISYLCIKIPEDKITYQQLKGTLINVGLYSRKIEGLITSVRNGREEESQHITYMQVKVSEESSLLNNDIGKSVELNTHQT